MTDPFQSLSPLDPQTVKHLTATLGPPTSFLLKRDGDRDISATGWLVGVGRTGVGGPDPSKWTRGTDVEIRLTVGGYLVTTRFNWSRTPDGDSTSGSGRAHPTPHDAYQWLLNDSKGKLGPASKEAWTKTCRIVPPMAGMEFERVD